MIHYNTSGDGTNSACGDHRYYCDDASPPPPEPPLLACVSWEHRLAGHVPRAVVTDADGLMHILDPLPRPPLSLGEPAKVPAEVWRPG